MVTREPTFAGVTLSQFMQLPKGVTVTLAGAGGQAPIISLTDPAALLPTSLQTPRTTQPIGGAGHLSLSSMPGGDSFLNSNPLGISNPRLGMTPQAGGDQVEGGPGKGKGKGRHGGGPPGLMKKGGLPPGLAKKQAAGQSLPSGNPWSQSLQMPMGMDVPAQPGMLQAQPNGIQSSPLLAQPQAANLPDSAELSSMPGLPMPTLGLSPEPGATVQFGPPLA